jgi:aromatic-L-amino-acid decarboxylase
MSDMPPEGSTTSERPRTVSGPSNPQPPDAQPPIAAAGPDAGSDLEAPAGDLAGSGLGVLDEAQLSGHGDMDPESFRRAAHAVADLMADYLAGVERFPILPDVEPGDLRRQFPVAAPERPEPVGDVLDDYRRLVEPNITHWQHPAFFAYFASSGSGPGILGEMLMATLVGNAMLWRTSPVATELEEVTIGWLRRGLGLPEAFDGFFTDSASTSSLIGLAGARQSVPGMDASGDGLAGHPGLRIYASAEAHSSIEKAAMTLGIGRAGTRLIPTDAGFRMDTGALEAAIREDRAAGHVPCAIVSTIGTTGPTSVDPTEEIAGIAEREGLWLHVDAAYAGATALLPERRAPFAGWERADSIVVNPHKWLFTPLDASLFLTRRSEVVRAAFSLVPEYLRTLDRARDVHDFNEYTPQLGRRFRALKMWILLRYFGLEGMRMRLREHIALAAQLADRIDAEPDAERLAPVPFSTVCFRWRPARFAGREDEPEARAELDRLNTALLDAVNREGRVFLSHTRLRDRMTLRIAIGSIRTEERHVALAWERICEHGRRLAQG